MFAKHPTFAIRLALARLRFFALRSFQGPLRTADNYLIESEFELISYWSFFVERECWSKVWIDALIQETAPVVLDVGANAGLFTHLVWSLKPSAQLYAFDPLPQMAQKISRWAANNRANVTVVNKAVAAKPGIAIFHTASNSDTTASLYDDGSKKSTIEVETTTLDQTVERQPILLIKIDVEGAETDVINGARQTLANTRFLIVEAHTPDALSRVAAALGKEWSNQQIGASDYFFTRRV